MCSICMEDMMDSPDTDLADRHGNKLKRSRRQIIEFMTKPKSKCVVDWSKCHHDIAEGFQAESDFTYLKKSFSDGMRKTGKADSLLDKNCMKCNKSLLSIVDGGYGD